MTHPMTLARRLVAWAGLLLASMLLGTAGWAWWGLRGSLPQLDGQVTVPGLTAPVTAARDDLGVVTIRGETRIDVARATGFLHAQDRFFQMDLARRRAAGELAALVGEAALPADRQTRIHRFRAEAHRAIELLPPAQRAILDAYTEGVNAGLTSLAARPFEYALLRQTPSYWRAEDSLLVVLSMFMTLQDNDGAFESTLATMHAVLPEEVFNFLVPRGTDWDSPTVGAAFPRPPIPATAVYDLRRRRAGRPTLSRTPRQQAAQDWLEQPQTLEAIGSNSWAIAGHLSASGGALLANDMHLTIRVPNTWYRALLQWQAPTGTTRSLVGVTLPGVPAVVVGSNTAIAWGFTNAYADTSDIVLLETDPRRPGEYLTADGWRRLETFVETIEVAGGASVTMPVEWTIWGPLLPPDFRGRQRALKWVAHSAEQLAGNVIPLEDATSVLEAFEAANGLGTPLQNLVVADRAGHIGWSVYGSLPRRSGLDGRFPQSWSVGERGWNGWLDPSEYPRVVDPESGRLWTANARVVDEPMLDSLGDGNWEVGTRARIIRDRLEARVSFTPGDFLSMQLDTQATFLERWRGLVLDTLTPSRTSGSPARQAFRDVVEHGWNGEAAAGSSAYRLTRMFRDVVSTRVFAFVLAECYERDPRFDYSLVRRREGPLWSLVSERPLHLLDPEFATWENLFLESIDAIVEELAAAESGDLRSRTWSQMNVTVYRHPLSAAVPLLGRWLDMPITALPGDLYTPRVHWGSQGASERMVVSPGREGEGIMQMPTGQSGHPLSPYYANSHEAWVEGRPTPLLPGPAVHTLTLVPRPAN